MMHLSNISKENRNLLYDYLSIRDFRLYVTMRSCEKEIYDLFQIPLSELTKEQLKSHLELYLKENDEVYVIFSEALTRKMYQFCPDVLDMIQWIHQGKSQKRYKEYKEEYASLKMPISFDTFIQLYE